MGCGCKSQPSNFHYYWGSFKKYIYILMHNLPQLHHIDCLWNYISSGSELTLLYSCAKLTINCINRLHSLIHSQKRSALSILSSSSSPCQCGKCHQNHVHFCDATNEKKRTSRSFVFCFLAYIQLMTNLWPCQI